MKKGPEMKEYTLIIKGEMDFIILSPQVLSSLITQIHNSPERKVVVSIESIMPPKFTDYLLRVINSNRFSNERFRYRYILENPVTKMRFYGNSFPAPIRSDFLVFRPYD